MSPEKQQIAIARVCWWIKSDCLNDLNAMHEAEKVMTDRQKRTYTANLWRMTHHGKIFASIHATAAEKCEAFLRTLGLWEEDAQ